MNFPKPHIKTLAEKKLVGKRLKMSLNNNKTHLLWKSFMPKRKEIVNSLSTNLISMQVYDKPLKLGDFNQEFEKWAVAEVSSLEKIPLEMESFILKSGLYAVFNYKGLNTDTRIFNYIYGVWLPNSDYIIDNRPHFEVLGGKYKNNDPNSEEEIWIPIKK